MCDRMMNLGYFKPTLVQLIKDLIWPNYMMRFLLLMRKCQYYNNIGGGDKLLYAIYKWRYNRLSLRMGFSISPNVFGYGLVIPHYGTIVVGETNHIGNYCVLHTSTCISGNGKTIGDGLYLATGAKITAKVNLGNNVSVAANAVVTKGISEDNILLAGIPAEIKCSSQAWYIRDGKTYSQRVDACEALKAHLAL